MAALFAGAALLCSAASVPGAETMRAVYATARIGKDFSKLRYDATTIPAPVAADLAADEVLVEVHGSSVNPVDLGLAPSHYPAVLGMDLAGVVTAVGTGCRRLKAGDRVWADNVAGQQAGRGSYAEYTVVQESFLGIVPSNINLTAAATLPLVAMTSLNSLSAEGRSLDTGKAFVPSLTASWWAASPVVVVLGASGGCGMTGVQMAKALGAGAVHGTTLGKENLAFVQSLGAGVVAYDAETQDVFSVLGADSVDLVYDTVGVAGTADKAMAALRAGGTFVTIAGAVSSRPKKGVSQASVHHWMKNQTALDAVAALVAKGSLQPRVQHAYDLADVAAAFSVSAQGKVVGKLGITVRP